LSNSERRLYEAVGFDA
jgi:hypothetical protein